VESCGLIMSFSRTWKVLEKRIFFKWLWKSFGFLFGEILNYPKMDFTQYRIEHHICYVGSFYYL